MGEVVFKDFLTYIDIRSILYIVKGYSMGLGKYEYKT